MKTQAQNGILFLISLLMVACTDRSSLPRTAVDINYSNPQNLVAVADVRYNQQPTTVLQMIPQGNTLLLTGRPFGFARFDVGADPENPQLIFAGATQIDRFFGQWVIDWWARGALFTLGQYAFMSGNVGASVVDMAETTRPKEVRRYPAYNEANPQVVADDAFVWAGTVTHPSAPYVYAFREQDYLLTYQVSGTNMTLVSKDSYGAPGQTVCCVHGATVFANRVFVAFRTRLVFYDFGPNGTLVNPHEFGALRAVNVTSTANYLYVQHAPQMSTVASSYPAGIYVFDQTGANVAYLPESPYRFAVNPNDSHLYANLDDQQLTIFRMSWAPQSQY